MLVCRLSRERPRRGTSVTWDGLTVEQREIRELVRTLTRERIAPRAAEIDETHEFPRDVAQLFAEQGIFGLFYDEIYGGAGTGALVGLIAIEEVSEGLRDERSDPCRSGARVAAAEARRHRRAKAALSCRRSPRESCCAPTL